MRKGSELQDVKGKRIFVGLSGGVDSAVTAALLKEAGADVTAVFIKGWYPPGMPCTWREDRRDAMRVAASLRLPFVTLDASAEYKSSVIDYLLSEYKAGRTPNPDIMCNRDVKFGAFHAYAEQNGADMIATGHYAQAVRENNGMEMGEEVTLACGIDPDKDQSYFLWAISKEALANTLFPLGGMRKTDVRALAEKFNLPNARKRDSQGICFLGSISVEEFLAQEFGTKPGQAVDSAGNVIGTHTGALLSTLGQRVRLEGALPGPWYVIAKDISANTLTVSKEHVVQAEKLITLTQTNWLSTPTTGKRYEAQYRYHGPRVMGSLNDALGTFTPNTPILEPVAPGQSLVIYDGDICIGGGIIG